MILQVALLSPPYRVLSYAPPSYAEVLLCRVGQRVCVPLGKGFRCGLIWKIDQAGTDVPGVKPVLWPLESSPLLSPDYLDFIQALAVRYAVSPGRVLGSVLPKNLRSINLLLRTQAV